MKVERIVFFALVGIVFVGIIGIPMGDPKFIVQAVSLEAAFIALAVLSITRINYVPIPSIIISVMVMIGNTVSPQHIDIMTSFSPLGNAIVLMVGGYFLQAILFSSSLFLIQKKLRLKIANRN